MQGLDGFRALAVIAVVWHHSHPGFAWLPASKNGFLGVDAFFVLSGFLITTLLLRELAVYGKISLKNFFVRRSLRIFPLYYAVLAVLTLYFLSTAESPSRTTFLGELAFHATYLSNWVPTGSLMGISWSLSTEEQFYLVWPLLLVALRARAALFILVAFLVLNQGINFGALDASLAALEMPYESLPILQITFTPIIFGVLLAFGMQSGRSKRWLNKTLVPGVLWVLLLVLVVLFNLPASLRGWPRLCLHLVITLLLAGIVLNPRHALTRALEWRPLAYVGTISYGVYLLHMLALDAVRRVLHQLSMETPEALFFFGMLLTVAIAGLSFKYFESPILGLKSAFRAPPPVTQEPLGVPR